MTAEHVRPDLLHDQAEGLLDAAEAAGVEAHLAACHRCRAELEGIRRFRAEAAALPGSLDPGVDLRPSIRAARRRAPTARGGSSARAWVAAAALAIGIGSAVTSWWWVEERGRGPAPPVARGAAPGEVPATLLALDREYARAGAELRETVEAASARLPPEAARLLRSNVAAVERALAESRAALMEDPASPVLRELVLTAHRQRLDVLRQAAALVAES